ncbi:tRNA lysidine(34) synthetase TilS [Lentibacillus sp. N15]|uniref:tRNA lysidine(34) synthetase TilS n=1 Tax=Lentibacillus songyuanensis TaxID=3136161 RepID=UPI0031BA44F7
MKAEVTKECGWVIMYQKVMAFIKNHQLLAKNKTVVVGVSGGPDSMALLHFFVSIRTLFQLRIIAVSVDHQLRGEESRGDLLYVQKKCAEWNIECYGTSVDVLAHMRKRKIGIEVAARELRYQVFAEQMNTYNADYLALGHHGDDQVETMLMGLVRSANTKALAGIPLKRPFADGMVIRPLLVAGKGEIEAYCQKHHIVPRRDPTNEESTFTRNYFRNEVIPLIKKQNHNIHTTAQHLSEALQADEQFIHQEASRLFGEVITLDETSGSAWFQIDHFQSYPLALQRRFYHLILNYLYVELPKDLSYVHEEHFFALLTTNKANIQMDFPRQLKVEKSYQTLRFYFLFYALRNIELNEALAVPGEAILPDGSMVRTEWTEDPVENEHTYVCGKDQIALPLHIRTRQDGDRMRWKGLKGSKKLKDIFIDAKIPKKERDNWPIVTDNKGEILWLIGLKKGQPRSETNATSFIKLYYEHNSKESGEGSKQGRL